MSNNNSPTQNEEIEEVIIVKKKFEKKKALVKQVVSNTIRNAVTTQLKIILFSFINAILPIILWSVTIFILWFFLLYMFVATMTTNQQNDVFHNEQSSNSPTSILSSLFDWNSIITNPEAKPFNSSSSIPHWYPASWYLVQPFCSNFIYKGKIAYLSHGKNLYHLQYCIDKMKKSPVPRLQSFAQDNAWGDWSKIWTHWGIDITAPIWSPIYSTMKWKVVRIIKNHPDLWNAMEIAWTDEESWISYTIRFAHLSKINVKLWDEVLAWSLVWLMGNTWMSTESHLHYDICKGAKSFHKCQQSVPWASVPDDYPYKIVNPFYYSYNFIINWESEEKLRINPDIDILENSIRKTYVKSWVWAPWLPIDYDYANMTFDSQAPMRKDLTDYTYIKIWLQEGVDPIILKTLHMRERSWGITNPDPKTDPGWSWHNEWVYWFYSDFSSISPICERSSKNFWDFWAVMTYQQFENQTTCAALVLKYKMKKDSTKLNFLKYWNFSVKPGNWDTIYNIMKNWNAWSFYTYNQLYPTYSNNSEYQNMPVYAWGKLIGINKQEGFIKYILDNYQNFYTIVDNYINWNKNDLSLEDYNPKKLSENEVDYSWNLN